MDLTSRVSAMPFLGRRSHARPFKWILCCLALFTAYPVSPSDMTHSAPGLADSEAFFLGVDFFSGNRGMHTYPGVIEQLARGRVPMSILENLGFILREGRPIGLTIKTVNGQVDGHRQEKFVGVISCAYCHTGKAAGIVIPGLANKRIDLRALGYWGIGLDLASDTGTHAYSPDIERLVANSQRMFAILDNPAFTSPTAGLVDNNILKKTFFQVFGLDYGDEPRAFLNKPGHLWGIGEKKKLGLFWGAEGSGQAIGWKVGPEIMNGQTAENIRRPDYAQKIGEVEFHIERLQPPAYPYAIDENLAFGTGKALFAANCGKCHGSYRKNADGTAQYQVPKLVPWRVVRTDPNRSGFFDQRLWSAIEESGFSDLLLKSGSQDMERPSYVAPRLEGIWSRFPYLHNTSVPTLMDLLTPAELRPVLFSLKEAGEEAMFDQHDVGLKTGAPDPDLLEHLSPEWVYDVRNPGHSNRGHEFGTDLAESDKRAIIEYLKTL